MSYWESLPETERLLQTLCFRTGIARGLPKWSALSSSMAYCPINESHHQRVHDRIKNKDGSNAPSCEAAGNKRAGSATEHAHRLQKGEARAAIFLGNDITGGAYRESQSSARKQCEHDTQYRELDDRSHIKHGDENQDAQDEPSGDQKPKRRARSKFSRHPCGRSFPERRYGDDRAGNPCCRRSQFFKKQRDG